MTVVMGSHITTYHFVLFYIYQVFIALCFPQSCRMIYWRCANLYEGEFPLITRRSLDRKKIPVRVIVCVHVSTFLLKVQKCIYRKNNNTVKGLCMLIAKLSIRKFIHNNCIQNRTRYTSVTIHYAHCPISFISELSLM